jgi:hypothetical protein
VASHVNLLNPEIAHAHAYTFFFASADQCNWNALLARPLHGKTIPSICGPQHVSFRGDDDLSVRENSIIVKGEEFNWLQLFVGEAHVNVV